MYAYKHFFNLRINHHLDLYMVIERKVSDHDVTWQKCFLIISMAITSFLHVHVVSVCMPDKSKSFEVWQVWQKQFLETTDRSLI